MKDKESSIKPSIDAIQVPSDKLDAIIDDALYEPTIKKTVVKKWIYPAAAAAILVIGMTTTTMIASPTLANMVVQIPVIGNVFNFLGIDESSFKDYEQFSAAIGLLESSNGIDLVIDQAIYDGTNVTLSFLLETDKRLGRGVMFENFPSVNGAQGNADVQVEYIENVGYVGAIRLTPDFRNEKSEVNISWEPGAIVTEDEEIKGDWKFDFAIKKISDEPMVFNEKVKTEGVTVHLKEATFTDVSVNIDYQQLVDPAYLTEWRYVEAELIAQDNLGKVYEVPYNGGYADGSAKTAEDLHWSATLSGLDPKATSLTFYPIATMSGFNLETESIEVKKIEFDALKVDLTNRSHEIIENPDVPKLPKSKE